MSIKNKEEKVVGQNRSVFYRLVKIADLQLSATCPLIEDEAIVWAGKRIEELEQDKKRLDWLASTEQDIGNVMLPKMCIQNNIDSMRGAIDSAMALNINSTVK